MCDKIAMRPRKRLTAPPFRLGWSSIWPGTHIGYIPDRYWANLESYIADGGASSSLDVKKFIKGNKKNNCGDLARYYMFRLIFDQIKKEKLEGDLLELGVYKGNTASLLAEMARHLGRTAYLLDTYGGFPKQDLTGVNAGMEASFAETSLESVRELVGDQNVSFIQGRFPETAAQLPDNASYCLVHLDCDLYAPFQAALKYFYPRLVPGGFLVAHDYSSLSWHRGPEQAIDEFLADKPERIVPIPDKSGTAIMRKLAR
jgi:O-methyltransferase